MPTIRPARRDDIWAITEIYNKAIVETTASYALEPVTLEDRLSWFEKRTAEDDPVLVLERDGEVIGFASYGPFRALAGYAFSREHSVYVREGQRSSGAGRMLMSALIDYARGHGIHALIGVIDAANQESISFHRKLGFQEAGLLPQVGRKFDRWLDVAFVVLLLDQPEPS